MVTRKQMCEDLNISYHTLNSLFKRRTERMPLEMIQKIAEYLKTTVEYLAFGTESTVINVDSELMEIVKSLDQHKKDELLKFAKYLKNT
jgi:transcriptional regulator with XRE-family HTH domain